MKGNCNVSFKDPQRSQPSPRHRLELDDQLDDFNELLKHGTTLNYYTLTHFVRVISITVGIAGGLAPQP